jgi:hypothetical protein
MPTPASSTYSLPALKDSSSVDTDADTEISGEPISVPDTGDHGEGGKLKMIIQLVKRALGVKDIAAMCVVALSFNALSHTSTHQAPVSPSLTSRTYP